MIELKLQIACLVVLLYVAVMYMKETFHYSCNKYFDAILAIGPWAVFFDGFSLWTINRMDIVPAWLNYGAHLLFYLCTISILTESAMHIYDRILSFKEHSRAKIIISAPGILAGILATAGIGKVHFIQGEHTFYSMGFSVYVCFATVFLYYIIICLLIITRHKFLSKQKKFGALSYITLVGVILILQIIFPEILITSLATTMLVLGAYMEFENPAIRKMEIQNQKMIDSFATLVESRDNSTGGHIKRTRQYVSLLLKKMQRDNYYKDIMTLDYITNVEEAAPLHDIGKISTPDEILQKPGKLTNEEYEIMKQHAANGGEIIQHTFWEMKTPEAKKIAYEVARYHHEKYNGKGYPEGLSGEQIPLHARIMAIADVFDAVSQKRCYRDAMPIDQCFEIIEKGSGTDFDPKLVELFMDERDIVEELCIINREM